MTTIADLFFPPELDVSWQDKALCAQVDPELFFPEKGESPKDAIKICNLCEVRSECLEYALARNEQWGIWGGKSVRERRKLKMKRLAAAARATAAVAA